MKLSEDNRLTFVRGYSMFFYDEIEKNRYHEKEALTGNLHTCWSRFHHQPGGGFRFPSGAGQWTGLYIRRLRVTSRDRDCVGLVGEGQWTRLRYGFRSEKTHRVLRESRKRVGPTAQRYQGSLFVGYMEDEVGNVIPKHRIYWAECDSGPRILGSGSPLQEFLGR